MNSITERCVQTCQSELLDRTLIWNQHHLPHALREFETYYNERDSVAPSTRTNMRHEQHG
ncbi:hypothetical protein [Streptomyces sp. NBC_01361]|uniref:hypothetical protein n=1 Tax=Streptomyces sp. NBC_01361 TaxID=2903838 RepID=UPI003FCDBBB2